MNKPEHYSVVADHDQLPELTVSQEDVDAAHLEVFGPPEVISFHKVSDLTDSNWTRLFDQYYQERIVHVRSNNVLLLRFEYDYEVDLDRVKTPVALLSWTLHLAEKNWINTERLKLFADAVIAIKKFKIYGKEY